MSNSDVLLWDETLRRNHFIWPLNDQTELKDSIDPILPDGNLQKLRQGINGCLEVSGGEVSARMKSGKLGEAYLAYILKGPFYPNSSSFSKFNPRNIDFAYD